MSCPLLNNSQIPRLVWDVMMIKVPVNLEKNIYTWRNLQMFVQAPQRVVGLYPGLGMQYEMCFADLRRTEYK